MLDTTEQNAIILRALSAYSVRFLLVGGFAVHFYCDERDPHDLDLLLAPSLENGARVIAALTPLQQSLHFGIHFTPADLVKPNVLISLKNGCNADLLTPDAGFPFDAAFETAAPARLNGIELRVPSRADLIRLKTTDRAVDRSDLELLHRCGDP